MSSVFELWWFCLLRLGNRVVLMRSIGPEAKAETNGLHLNKDS